MLSLSPCRLPATEVVSVLVRSRVERRLSRRSFERSRKASSAFPGADQRTNLVAGRVGLPAPRLEVFPCSAEVGIAAAEGRGRRGDLVLGLGPVTGNVCPKQMQRLGLDGVEPLEMVFELGLEFLVALGLFRLAFDLAQAAIDLADHIVQSEEILTRMFELELRLVFAGLVAGDSRGFLDQDPAIDGAGRQDLADTALLDDGVGPGAETDIRQLVEYVFEADGPPVEAVLGRARAKDPAADLEAPVGLFPVTILGLEHQRHLGRPGRGPGSGAAEDHVPHLFEPHQGGALLAENPEDGVDNVRFPAAVGADDRRHLPRKGELHLVRKRLEACEPQRNQTN